MDGEEESLWTGRYYYLGLHSHHVCNEKPPDKVVTFLIAKKTTHPNRENSAILSFNSEGMVLLHSKPKILAF